MYSKEVLVNEINGIINCVNFSYGGVDLYLNVTFFHTVYGLQLFNGRDT